MGQFNIRLLSDVTEEFLRRTSESSHVTLTTPYFNLPEELERIMLYDSEAAVQIVTTSQEVIIFTYCHCPKTYQLVFSLHQNEIGTNIQGFSGMVPTPARYQPIIWPILVKKLPWN